jgi:outer membrane protein assembly factor BamB
MPKPPEVIYIGIGGHVVAISALSGEERWRCKLKRSSFITLLVQPNAVYAGAAGELFCIDPSSGTIRWQNRLNGLGTGVIAFNAASTASVLAAAVAAAQAAAVAAGAAG